MMRSPRGIVTSAGLVPLAWLALLCPTILPLSAQGVPAPPRARAAELEAVASDTVLLGGYLRAVAVGDTGLIVADASAGHLFVFDRRAGLVRTFAQSGDGPGEFRVAASLGLVGDAIWLFDPTQGRLTVYGLTGEVRSSRHLTPPSHAPGPYLAGIVVGARSDGVLAWEFDVARLALASAAPIRHTVVRVAAEGDVRDTLASFDRQMETWPVSGAQGQTAILPNPFSYSPLWSALPDASGVVVVVPDPLPTRNRGSFRISWHTPGRPVAQVVVPYRPVVLRRAWADSMARQVAAPLLQSGAFSWVDVRRAMDARLLLPTYLPPVTALLLSAEGAVWVRREDPSWTQVEWSVWARDGTPVATFSLPSGVRGLAAHGRILWGLQADSLGADHLVRYRF